MEKALKTPAQIYDSLVTSGRVSEDASQRALIARLDTLYKDLLDYRPIHCRRGWKQYLPWNIWRCRHAMPRGVYIYGEVGRGKSMLMDLLFDAAPTEKKRRVHFHAFMLDVHARIHKWREENKHKIKLKDPIPPVARQLAKEASLLCFDEFQVHDVADAMIMARLFALLFHEGVVMVTTSNRHPDKLYLDGLQRERFMRFVELVKSRIDIFELQGGEDYRLKQLKALNNVYHAPLGNEAEHFLVRAFETLTHGAGGKPVTLEVQGRKLEVPIAHGDIAWFRFSDLCEKPLGAADYIEIAQEFHTVLISGIPQLTPEKRNEAKRFVTLIDELYNHKVKLVCTAQSEPQALYPQGDGSFEFERTVSRLMEMRSEKYLAQGHIVRSEHPA